MPTESTEYDLAIYAHNTNFRGWMYKKIFHDTFAKKSDTKTMI